MLPNAIVCLSFQASFCSLIGASVVRCVSSNATRNDAGNHDSHYTAGDGFDAMIFRLECAKDLENASVSFAS